MVLVRQWVIGVARNAQHLALFAVNAHPHATLRPAAEALRHGDNLLRVLLPARLGIGFGDEGVTKDAIRVILPEEPSSKPSIARFATSR